jgi:hypothetical protein
MKKFLKKIALRLFILLLVWVAVSRLIPKEYYLGAVYLRWQSVFAQIEAMKEKPGPRNLILGDSGAEMGLDAKQLRANNFALGGTSFPEGFHILSELKDHPIDTLFMSYGMFHFQSMECFYTATEFLGFFPDDFIEEVLAVAESEKDSTYLVQKWEWRKVLHRTFPFEFLRKEVRYVHDYYNFKKYAWYFREGQDLRDSLQANQCSFLVAPKGCPADSASLALEMEEKDGHFRVSAVNAHYLSKILQLCEARGIHVVWVNMPLSTATRQPSEGFFNEFDHALKMMLPASANIVPFQTLDHCQFRDFAHLHRDGARAYTRWLSAYLQAPLPDSLNSSTP